MPFYMSGMLVQWLALWVDECILDLWQPFWAKIKYNKIESEMENEKEL